MFADELRQIQATRYKVDPEYFDQCIGYINRDLREAAKESDSRRFIYYIRDGEFILYQRNESYLPGDPCVLRVSEKMIPKLQEYYKEEGIKVTCYVQSSDYTKLLEFSW